MFQFSGSLLNAKMQMHMRRRRKDESANSNDWIENNGIKMNEEQEARDEI